VLLQEAEVSLRRRRPKERLLLSCLPKRTWRLQRRARELQRLSLQTLGVENLMVVCVCLLPLLTSI